MALEIHALQGADLPAAMPNIAALRMAVFREWPYLYDGDLAYEATYLAPYQSTPQAIVVGAFDGTRLVGASTGMPIEAHSDGLAAAFGGTSLDASEIFYCAESVLLPAYRGQGAGQAFFDLRETFARDLGYKTCAFCAVIRPKTHAARPEGYRPLDAFWTARGYAPLPGVIASLDWKDVATNKATPKQLQFWARRL